MASQVADKRRYGFGQWLNSPITHDNIGSLIPKTCHPKSYHSDIICHTSLNIILSVVSNEPVGFEKQLVGVQDFMKITNHCREVYGTYLKLTKGKPEDHNM
jgi:hypothetical protein